MYSSNVINCPFCEADIQVNHIERSVQCPFCGKMFNRAEGKKTRDIQMQRQFIVGENTNEMKRNQTTMSSVEKVKYCTECGRKLAYDAKYCDWCGTKVMVYG